MREQRLIDANALDSALLTDGLASALIGYPGRRKLTVGEVRGILQRAPTIDPVKHGRWVEAMQGEMHLYPDGQKMCNVCHTIMPSTWNAMPPFCFVCGAKMDGGV